MPQGLLRCGTAPTITYPSSNAISRPAFGATSSSMPRKQLGVPRGSIRATVLIETIHAAFEMEEILYELREHAAGTQRGPMGLHLQPD